MSWGAIYNNSIAALQAQMTTLAHLQEQAASGLKIIRASDSPSDAATVMQLASQTRGLEIFTKNINRVALDTDQASSAMESISDAMLIAKQLLTQAASQTYGDADRIPIAQQIDQLLQQSVSLANTQSGGRYIFSGASPLTQPYSVTRSGDTITSVNYQGSTDILRAEVAPGVTEPATLIGEQVFRMQQRQAPVFFGQSGAQAGTGTSNATGDVWLTVLHGATSYAGATGVAAGASSAARDTIIGGGHTITIDIDDHTVSLDSGVAVAYTALDTDLQLRNAQGDSVFVNMSGLDADLTGQVQVAVSATGKLSLDDGATATAIDFSANQAVTDSRTGEILYVNSSAIKRVGIDPVRVPGTYDLFETLINARDLLLNTRRLSSEQQNLAIRKMVDSVNEVSNGIVAATTSLGARSQVMDNIKTSLQSTKTNLQTRQSSLEDADVLSISADLARFQSFYQITLAATSKVLNLSLLDYLTST